MLTFSIPSSERLLPANEVAGIYHEIAQKVMILFHECCSYFGGLLGIISRNICIDKEMVKAL
jgi:hypothetical protein